MEDNTPLPSSTGIPWTSVYRQNVRHRNSSKLKSSTINLSAYNRKVIRDVEHSLEDTKTKTYKMDPYNCVSRISPKNSKPEFLGKTDV